jgi:hypothetical protein
MRGLALALVLLVLVFGSLALMVTHTFLVAVAMVLLTGIVAGAVSSGRLHRRT